MNAIAGKSKSTRRASWGFFAKALEELGTQTNKPVWLSILGQLCPAGWHSTFCFVRNRLLFPVAYVFNMFGSRVAFPKLGPSWLQSF